MVNGGIIGEWNDILKRSGKILQKKWNISVEWKDMFADIMLTPVIKVRLFYLGVKFCDNWLIIVKVSRVAISREALLAKMSSKFYDHISVV